MKNSARIVTCVALISCLVQFGSGMSEPVGPSKSAPSRLTLVRDAALAADIEPAKREELALLFQTVTEQTVKFQGKDFRELKDDMPSKGPLKQALNRLADEIGIHVAAAVLLDTTEDDYVRQAALTVLMEYKDYTINDLPLLAKIYGFLPTESPFAMTPRSWLTPFAAHLRLAAWIGHVLGIEWVAATAVEGPLSAKTASKQPNVWLHEILKKAMNLPQNAKNRKLIASCLVVIGWTD